MQLSRTADHALRAVLYLAQHTEAPVPADAVARALGAPSNYLSKTLHLLSKAGLVEGFRGPTGGFVLTRPADELTVAEILDVVNEPEARTACLLGDRPCDDREPCSVHRHWVAIVKEARAPFERSTIADLLRDELAP